MRCAAATCWSWPRSAPECTSTPPSTGSRETARPARPRRAVPRLTAQRVLQLHQQAVRFVAPAVLEPPQVVVVDEEDVAARVERPAQAGVRPQRARLGVVLQEAVELEIGGEVQAHPRAHQREIEGALGQ